LRAGFRETRKSFLLGQPFQGFFQDHQSLPTAAAFLFADPWDPHPFYSLTERSRSIALKL
jgi:hypothetical protein